MKILIRFDDVAQNMNWDLMSKCESLFDKFTSERNFSALLTASSYFTFLIIKGIATFSRAVKSVNKLLF